MPVQGRDRILYLAGIIFVVLIGGYLVRRIFLPNPETSELPSSSKDGQDVKFEPLPITSTTELFSTSQTTSSFSEPTSISDTTPEHDLSTTPPDVQPDGSDHVVVFSKMTTDGKWFPIDFGDYSSYNPNLVPHPDYDDTWYMIAQGGQPAIGGGPRPLYSLELVCEATFVNRTMKCNKSPTSVPIASTVSDYCTEDLSWFNYFIGPTDPRVFFGPDRPYITYGSASHYTCLGQWIHDLRRLVRWNTIEALDRSQRFFWPTELQRPPPYGSIEKNWFAFWDRDGEMYLHYDIMPRRSFAKVSADGSSISEDLAPLAAERDEKCLQSYMPTLRPKEHIHQATNSLKIVLCNRADLECQIGQNTYIFTIFHHKTYYGHNLYEPYLMIFEQRAPFEIYAMSAKPFWISGRGKPGENWSNDPSTPPDQSQMMYVTSVNWKKRGLNDTGFLDDELLIAFGIEDKDAGAIDVTAEQLFKELNFC